MLGTRLLVAIAYRHSTDGSNPIVCSSLAQRSVWQHKFGVVAQVIRFVLPQLVLCYHRFALRQVYTATSNFILAQFIGATTGSCCTDLCCHKLSTSHPGYAANKLSRFVLKLSAWSMGLRVCIRLVAWRSEGSSASEGLPDEEKEL